MAKTKTMTEGSEWKLILLFTLPLIAGNFLQQLYNAVDGIIVGNFAASGEDALSAVGTCAPVTMLFISIALGMGTGCSILISQLYGAKRFDEMRRAVSTSLILVVGTGLVLSVAGGVVARWVLRNILAVPEVFLGDATSYFSIYCFGLVFQFTYNIVSFILRSLGDSSATLYFLLVSSVTNILLDLLFVAGFHWDVPGAAAATVIAQALSAVVSVIYMFKKYPMLRFSRKEFRFHREQGKLAIKLSVPTTLQQCVISFGHIAIQRIVNDFGLTAAFTAGMRMESFIMIPTFAFNVGLSTFTGQNVGAGRLDRVKRGLRATWAMGIAVCAVVAALAWAFAPQLTGLFGVSGDTLTAATGYLRFIAPWMLVFCVFIVINGVLQGAGDVTFTAFSTVLNLMIRTVCAYMLAYLTPLGGTAAWKSLPIGWVIALMLSGARYRWGPWRKKAVARAQEPAADKEETI